MTPFVSIIPRMGAGKIGLPARLWPVILAMLGLAVLALTSCGSSDNGVAAKPASGILSATRTAAQGASSVHVIVNAKILQGRAGGVDAHLGKQQGRARVSLLGISFEVIRDGDALYVKGDQQFNARLEATMGVKVPSGVWLKGTTTGSLSRLSSFTDITSELPVTLAGSGPVIKGTKVKIDGQPAITIKETRKLYTGTLYVAATGQPYPLKLVKTGRETGETTFTGWNDPVTVTPPAHAVEIAKLQHLKGR